MNPLLLLALAGGGIALIAVTSDSGSLAWSAFKKTANKFASGKDATVLAAYAFGFVDSVIPNGLDAEVEKFRKAGQSASSISRDLEAIAEATIVGIALVATQFKPQSGSQLNYFNLTSLIFQGSPDKPNLEAEFALIVKSARTKYPEFTGNELVPKFAPATVNASKASTGIGYGCSGCAGRNGIGYGCSACSGRIGVGYGCSRGSSVGGRLYRRVTRLLRA